MKTFAVIANRRTYDVEAAAAALEVDTWSLPAGDVAPGDRFLVWRTLGTDGERGVVALGEVLAAPDLVPPSDVEAPFWRQPMPTETRRRFRFRYVMPPGLPLWLHNDKTGVLDSLTVSRGQGTKVYTVTPAQWQAIVEMAGGWDVFELGEDAPDSDDSVPPAGRRNGGQGYSSDAARNKAVELRAMRVVRDHLEQSEGWSVNDTSAFRPYDFFCQRAEERLYVEVKGTTTAGASVHVTIGEVTHARRHEDECALYVVTGIEVTRAGQEVVASGGSIDVVLRPWRVDAVGELLPKTFEYRLAPR